MIKYNTQVVFHIHEPCKSTSAANLISNQIRQQDLDHRCSRNREATQRAYLLNYPTLAAREILFM